VSLSTQALAVRPQLGASQGVRHTRVDIALGQDIAARGAQAELDGLVELLADEQVASSAIKAIYECGYLAPQLLVPHLPVFRAAVDGRNNRMVWGGMIAIWCVAKADPDAVWAHRERLEQALRQGTVITQMSAVQALTTVAGSDPAKAEALSAWFEEVLETIGSKQLVQCAELILPVAAPEQRCEHLLGIAIGRADELVTNNAHKRLQRLVRRFGEG